MRELSGQAIWLLVQGHKVRCVAKLNPRDGTIQIIDLGSAEAVCRHTLNGWVNVDGADVSAVYADGETMVFQNGCERWDLGSPDVQVRFTKGNKDRRFEILQNGCCVFCRQYLSPFLDMPFDPTFDLIDEESGDFYFRMSNLINSPGWTSEVSKSWSPRPVQK